MGNTVCPEKSKDDRFSKKARSKMVKIHLKGCKN